MKDINLRQAVLLLVPAFIAFLVYGSVLMILGKADEFNCYMGGVAGVVMYLLDFNFVVLRVTGWKTWIRYSLIIVSVSVTAVISGEYIFDKEIHHHYKETAKVDFDNEINDLTVKFEIASAQKSAECTGKGIGEIVHGVTIWASGDKGVGKLCNDLKADKTRVQNILDDAKAKGPVVKQGGLAENVGALWKVGKNDPISGILIIFITLGVAIIEAFPLLMKDAKTPSELKAAQKIIDDEARAERKRIMLAKQKAEKIMNG